MLILEPSPRSRLGLRFGSDLPVNNAQEGLLLLHGRDGGRQYSGDPYLQAVSGDPHLQAVDRLAGLHGHPPVHCCLRSEPVDHGVDKKVGRSGSLANRHFE